MKHAKHMLLVPEDMIKKFEQKQRLETSPILSNMLQKDAQLSTILEDPNVNDGLKDKLYYTNLERYINLKEQKGQVKVKPSKISTYRICTGEILDLQ